MNRTIVIDNQKFGLIPIPESSTPLSQVLSIRAARQIAGTGFLTIEEFLYVKEERLASISKKSIAELAGFLSQKYRCHIGQFAG